MSEPRIATKQMIEQLFDETAKSYNRTGPNIFTHDIVYASAEEWWAFLLTFGTRATILEMNEVTRAQFKEEYLEKLRPMIRQDGLHISVEVIYAVAQR